MQRILSILLLLSATVNAYGEDVLLHYHDFRDEVPYYLTTGSALTFSFWKTNALLSFNIVTPEMPQLASPPFQSVRNYYESDASSLGFSWNELESLMASPPGMMTTFGNQEFAHQTTVSFPLLLDETFIDSYPKVDLNRITVTHSKVGFGAVALIEFYGEVLAVPEPSSALLSVICLSSFVVVARTRRIGDR